LRLLAPFAGRTRIGLQHGTADRGTDLPQCPAREEGGDEGLGGRPGIIQHPGGLGDDLRLEDVDDPFAQRTGRQREPHRQVMGQRQHPLGSPPRAHERDGQLIGAELPPPRRDTGRTGGTIGTGTARTGAFGTGTTRTGAFGTGTATTGAVRTGALRAGTATTGTPGLGPLAAGALGAVGSAGALWTAGTSRTASRTGAARAAEGIGGDHVLRAAGTAGSTGTGHRAAADQLRDRQQPPGGGPGLSFLPGGQDTDQLIIIDAGIALPGPGDRISEPGQRRPRQRNVQHITSREPAARPGTPGNRTGTLSAGAAREKPRLQELRRPPAPRRHTISRRIFPRQAAGSRAAHGHTARRSTAPGHTAGSAAARGSTRPQVACCPRAVR